MRDDVARLVSSVAENDMKSARRWAKEVVEADKAQKDESFRKRVLQKLSAPVLSMMELPQDIRGMLQVEDVVQSFDVGLYHLSMRECKLLETITAARGACDKLKEMRIRHVNATLLTGESGTGKTTFGRYVAFCLGVPFAYVNFSLLVSSYLGSTGKNIYSVFEYIKKTPCVFMLDEVDAIAISRDNIKEVGEMSRVVISLMQSFDLLDNDVTVIAATNRLDIIDKAFLRRFTTVHEVMPLDESEAINLAIRFLNRTGMEYSFSYICNHIGEYPKNQAELINELTKRVIASIQSGDNYINLDIKKIGEQ